MVTPLLLKDIYPGSNGSFPLQPTVVGKNLFFSAQDGSRGRELWRTNGTPTGTIRLKDIYLGGKSSTPNYLLADGNRLLFTARDREDERPGLPDDDLPFTSGRALWSSDGTSTGTVRTGPPELEVGYSSGGGYRFFKATLMPPGGQGFGYLYNEYSDDFDDPAEFASLPRGTSIEIKGAFGSPIDPDAFYHTKDILYYSQPSGQLKAYDFRTSSKVVLASGIDTFSDPVAMGNSLSFTVKNGLGQTVLWRSNNGSAAGTAAVAPIPTGSAQFTAVGSSVYFTAPAAGGVRHLWRSNGTAAGTKRVSTVPVVTSDSASLASLGDRVVFAARDPVAGVELWSSDGTAAGTQRVADIVSGAGSSNPKDFAAVGSTVYFSATHPSSGRELWRTDGTAAGTWRLADVNPGKGSSNPSDIKGIGNTLYFAASHPSSGRELWSLKLDDSPPDSTPPVISGITVQGGELLVQFSEPIVSTGVPTSRFAAMVGATARTITAIQAGADASQLRLSLSGTAPSSSQSVRLSYGDPAGDQSSGVVQDGAGNDLASIAAPGRAADTFNSASDVLSLASTTSHLNLLGSGNIKGTGNGKANRIKGNSGTNLLNGLGGNDVITGGPGGDTFRFSTAPSGSGNRDQLTDFTPAQGDRIQLENAIFTALPSTGPLAAAAFTIGSGATTAAHRIIYNAGTGSLSYDSNGSAAGGATVFALLEPNLLLSHSMFTVT